MEGFSLAAGVVVLMRLLVPLSIFKWNIGGGIAAMLADGLDVVVLDFVSALLGEPPRFGVGYQAFDKSLDTYYLSFEAIVSFKWTNRLARNTSISLFAYRLVGLIAFEITGMRKLFFFFPNLFEHFYLYYVIARRFVPKVLPRTLTQLLLILLVLLFLKLGQEWMLHVAIFNPWQWFKELVGWQV